MPSKIQAVDKPVPVPISRKVDPRFALANVLSKEQVSMSEAMLNPAAFVSSSIFQYSSGIDCSMFSFMAVYMQ